MFSICLPTSSIIRLLTASLVFLCGVTATHAAVNFEETFDDAEKPGKEIEVRLPAAPKPENLALFDVSATATQTFAVDLKSITVGADEVIRYILISTSSAGFNNVSYEGIRCASFEKKSYAFGRPDGTWSRSRKDKWERIVRNAANRPHAVLAQAYFCQNLTVAGSAEKMMERLRSKRPLGDSGVR